ncbi:hypothetical protein CXG81DRAFT_25483 [Caulochytrium protostelioides]|uniref:Uncharacterized protein n=1 Tax=Caulochytrium protostelioides TaxID=1555241 RepID=A0A4P9X9Z2_9FUNG|nr:hypothetical protein CXG81DRAFT_25483 [Caulochytrium protostelioides]|eukprot:RKP01851.1 hypothetical protein CXG81DRAFT_25483 [Caulochytrium protostelioides]
MESTILFLPAIPAAQAAIIACQIRERQCWIVAEKSLSLSDADAHAIVAGAAAAGAGWPASAEMQLCAPTTLQALVIRRVRLDTVLGPLLAAWPQVLALPPGPASHAVLQRLFPETTRCVGDAPPPIQAFLDNEVYPVLTQGLAELCHEKPQNPTSWLGRWLLENNPRKPNINLAV